MKGINAGLVLAGGMGLRLPGHGRPKQFVEAGGKPLIMHCLQAFGQCPGIALVCVVAAEEWRHMLGDYIFAAPGKSRQHSIYNGLLALERRSPARVVIHDAARPLVTVEDIAGVIRASHGHDGATPALAVTDTMYRSIDGGTISEALSRDGLFAGQTPECYAFLKYLRIHKQASDEELSSARGSSELAVRHGLRIAICKGNPGNFKVTTAADLERFRGMVEI